ncbi:hypothetical protein EVAR_73822_1, partial [Eumeta japonica]
MKRKLKDSQNDDTDDVAEKMPASLKEKSKIRNQT